MRMHQMCDKIITCMRAFELYLTVQGLDMLRNKHVCVCLVWMYGFLCVTAINLCALFGLIFLPLMKQRVYHHVLLFMVALAVGTLCGTALLVLLPEVKLRYVQLDCVSEASLIVQLTFERCAVFGNGGE